MHPRWTAERPPRARQAPTPTAIAAQEIERVQAEAASRRPTAQALLLRTPQGRQSWAFPLGGPAGTATRDSIQPGAHQQGQQGYQCACMQSGGTVAKNNVVASRSHCHGTEQAVRDED